MKKIITAPMDEDTILASAIDISEKPAILAESKTNKFLKGIVVYRTYGLYVQWCNGSVSMFYDSIYNLAACLPDVNFFLL